MTKILLTQTILPDPRYGKNNCSHVNRFFIEHKENAPQIQTTVLTPITI